MSLLDKFKGVPTCQHYRRCPSDVSAALYMHQTFDVDVARIHPDMHAINAPPSDASHGRVGRDDENLDLLENTLARRRGTLYHPQFYSLKKDSDHQHTY
jgi:hypothetical protein